MMEECSKRNVGRVKKDIISELPQSVIDIILCFLTIDDAVRTSFLSRAWRHRWTMIPHLIFYECRVCSMMEKNNRADDRELQAYRFVSVINKVLLLHKGPILEFSLAIPRDDDCDAKIIHDYINQWLSLLSRNGVKQLILEDCSLRESNAHNFSSLDLTHLTLLSVWFPYTPACGRFTCLKNLELVDATSNFGQSIFDCPVLEKLTLIICEGLFPNNFYAPNLKCLIQIYREITSEYSLGGLENLSEYSLMLLEDYPTTGKTFNVVIVPGGLHKIDKFSIAMYCMKGLAAGGSPNRLSRPLPYLKALNISHVDFTVLSEVSCLLCLIRSAPNLCKIHISNVQYAGEGDLEEYCIEDSEDCTILHLETFSFSEFKGLSAELELVKFLLAHSPLLKTIFIHRHWSIKEGALALAITEEMLEYPRASSRAQIRHLERPVEINNNFDFRLWSEYTF